MFWRTADSAKMQKWRNHMPLNTESMLPISEIRGDVIVLKDWGLRSIIKVFGLNLDLKNYEEQLISIEQYKRFLNWLDFPIQIVARSSYLDLTDYIEYMKEKVDVIENEILKEQWNMYISFLDDINSKQWLIYTKEFYIVIPYYSFEWDMGKMRRPWWKKFLDSLDNKESAEKIIARYRDFVKNRQHLDTRCYLVMEWLRNVWIVSERLDTPDIISLLFKVHNPTSQKQDS